MNDLVPMTIEARRGRLREFVMEQGARPNSSGYIYLFYRLRDINWGRFVPEVAPTTRYDPDLDRAIILTTEQREEALQRIISWNDVEEARVRQVIQAYSDDTVLTNELATAYCDAYYGDC